MNLKFKLLSIFLFALTLSCYGQTPALLFSPQNQVTADSHGVIRKIKAPATGKNLMVVYNDGQKRKLLKDDLWGFLDRKGRSYRIDDNKVFRVVRQDDIVKYDRKLAGTNQYQRRFSADLESPLVQTKRKARLQQEE
ncbi:MAG: hypothetical protein K9G42_06915 [Pedobacter sp.]|nr:hypothetical protein [Pedobacter sp.]